MSLINKMLQDLESRRATLGSGAGASQEIRPLPPQRVSVPWAKLLSAAAVAVFGGFGVWWYAGTQDAQVAPPVAPGPASSPAAPAPAASSALPPAAVAAPETPSAVAASGQRQVSAVQDKTGKTSPPPSSPPVRAEPPRAQPSSTARAEAVKPRHREDREIGLRVATSLGSMPQSQPVAADDARIEKKMRTSTPRERAENEYRRALGLVNQGRIQEAAAVLRAALGEDHGHLGARLALFGLLVEQQRLEEAQALLQEALARDPLQPQLASRLARLQLERGDSRGAAETLGKAAGAAANDAEFRAFHAAVLQRLTLHKDAVTEYQAALRLAPQAGVWWMGLGISLEADGRGAEAREAFQRARSSGALSAELDRFVEQKLRQLQ